MRPPYPPAICKNVLDALSAVGRIQPVARAYRIHNTTIARWAKKAGVKLAPAGQRIRQGSELAIAARWPQNAERRARAVELHAQGMTLEQIRAAVGYRSLAAVHYALRNAAGAAHPSPAASGS